MLLVGKINGIFGVKGWVKVFTYTQEKSNICQYTPWHIYQEENKQYQILEVIQAKLQGKTIIAQIKDINDCDQAKLLLGTKLYINPNQLPKSTKDEYYWHELKGMKVVNKNGVNLGMVQSLLNTNANDVLVVGEGKNKQLIPYHKKYLLNIDTDSQTITVDWEKDFT